MPSGGKDVPIRRSDRYRVILNVPMKLSGRRATLVDIAENGILATHVHRLQTGAAVEAEFDHEGQRFAAAGRVASCTVVAFNADDTGGTLYASRIQFTGMSDASRRVLQGILGG